MKKIAKGELPEKLRRRAIKFLHGEIVSINSEKRSETFLQLFSAKEKEALFKRCVIAVLLLEGKTYREIGDISKVSNSTISGIKRVIRGGEEYERYDFTKGKKPKTRHQTKHKANQQNYGSYNLPSYKGWKGWKNI